MKYLKYALILLVLSCNKEEKPSIYKGFVRVGIDGSIMDVIQAQTEAYAHHYRGAEFDNQAVPENRAVSLLLKDSLDLICITRLMNEQEMEILKQRRLKYIPAPMAKDAVVLISNPNSDFDQVDLEKLKDLFTNESSTTKLVFDMGNSSSLNLVLSKLRIGKFNKKNVVAAGGSENVFEWVKKDKNAIGFIGYNWVSQDRSVENRKRKNEIKILKLKTDAGLLQPNFENILDDDYPFSRTIYLHTLGNNWGVENGFIRYACTKPGQLIAEKMGLIPYYKIKKEYYLRKEPLKAQ